METSVIVLVFSLFGVFLLVIGNELRELIVKILIPSLVGISIKLAVQSKQGRVSLFNMISSIIVGFGLAFLFGDLVVSYVHEKWSAAVIAAIAMSGEKIAYWVIYQLRFDIIGDAFIEAIKNWILKK